MCTEISKEAAAYVVRADELADGVKQDFRNHTSRPPKTSTITVHKNRLLDVFRSAACHVLVLHIIFVTDIFFFTASKATMGPTQPPIEMVSRALSPE